MKVGKLLAGASMFVIGGAATVVTTSNNEEGFFAFLQNPVDPMAYGPCVSALVGAFAFCVTVKTWREKPADKDDVVALKKATKDAEEAGHEAERAARGEGAKTRTQAKDQHEELIAELAELKALLLAKTAPENESVPSDRAETRESAAERTVRQEPQAAREIATGDLFRGFEQLKAAARAKAEAAAEEWRDIGALAYDRDQQTALEAYREALHLAPDDCWTLINLARLEETQAGSTLGALHHAEQAVKHASKSYDKAVAWNEVGDARIESGDWLGGISAYEESLKIAPELVASSEGPLERRLVVISGWSKLGDVLMTSGEVGDAVLAYDECLKVCRELSALSEGGAGARREVIVALSKLGNALMASGYEWDAVLAYEESLKIARELSASNERSAEAQRDVSVALSEVGSALVASGEVMVGLSSCEEGLGITRALSASNAGSVAARRDVSVSLIKVGDALMSSGDISGAVSAYEESLEMRRELSASNAGSVQARRDVIVSLMRLGVAKQSVVELEEGECVVLDMKAKGQLAPSDDNMLEIIQGQIDQVKGGA